MAKDPQTRMDEELERSEHDAEPQAEPLEGQLDEASADTDEQAVADEDVGGADTPADPEAEILAAKVDELEQALSEAKDQALRTAAEAQNVRRRAEQDVEKARKFALEKFVKELLPVVDSLEKALESMGEDASEAHREGVSMTLKLQLDTLAKFGVESVEPQGEPFDPQYHEAMAMVPNPDLEPNTVMDVMQKGYLLNGRLVRPAMVVVSQAAK
ncbi:nucleotide exchange factor GrpE [Halomonas sp. McH1-25]|uniref:nucleotide exchange factor GrpE n=1 Tax=unclassified Halomonas TaxID=2609666 RepID=UPI001EF6CB4D|nr:MULTISPECIES: nucleotide exchange factor GrpE [unclassified Halomonas]MCG7599459.1 nucleotide exchange factor GrpE [Halomonas sp. McH1-25]MCP1342846.1 nucleotide exchange factor GrpE [Halomonas sp. FL8]MCP1361969.1 nucleotide exchange factor GrpE [Halomonas sp. BBD45]MCP1365201.1 nucleotide exchange factor GrpE [Halomonas sp. BBD48]